ncbi:hydrolase [Sporolactobacillus sp. THM7-4]|nr:hydrolase [Sporolactobacillus sp. THM7-4]
MNLIHSLTVRIRKYIGVIVAVPLILGIAGWFLPVGKAPSSYTAVTTVSLGNYNDPDFNDPSRVIVMLTNVPFFQERLPDLWKVNSQNLLSRFKVTLLKDQLIQLSYTGQSKDNVEQTVNKITDAFLASDRVQYQKRLDLIDRSISALNQARVSDNTRVDQQRFLYKLQSTRLDIKPAQLLKSASADIHLENRAFSRKARAVLGAMLGITIMFFFVVFPEVVREKQEQ